MLLLMLLPYFEMKKPDDLLINDEKNTTKKMNRLISFANVH